MVGIEDIVLKQQGDISLHFSNHRIPSFILFFSSLSFSRIFFLKSPKWLPEFLEPKPRPKGPRPAGSRGVGRPAWGFPSSASVHLSSTPSFLHPKIMFYTNHAQKQNVSS